MSTTAPILSTGEPLQAPKKRKSTKPPAIQNAILVKSALGHSKSQIAKDLDVSRNTVISILNQNEIAQHVAELRSDMVTAGDLRTSVKVLRSKLAKESESAATTILRGFNVLQSGNQMTVNVQNNGAMAWISVKQQEAESLPETPKDSK